MEIHNNHLTYCHRQVEMQIQLTLVYLFIFHSPVVKLFFIFNDLPEQNYNECSTFMSVDFE